MPIWQALAMTTLETLARSKACEALGRDPWSSVAPLITELPNGFARHIPADTGRGIQAIEACSSSCPPPSPSPGPTACREPSCRRRPEGRGRPALQTAANRQTARASIARPSPTGPIFSAVLAFTLTRPGSTPSASARRSRIAMM